MDVQNILKDKNMKVTKARMKILTILLNKKDGMTAEEIFDICRKNQININLSTVYRTLDAFYEHQIIDKFILEDGVSSYKLHKSTHKHILECDICHKEVEVQCPIGQIEELIKRQTGFTLTEHNIEIKGVCEECKKTSQK
ncbi:Fur family transcriptional regulator [Eubacterium multiforme]|uniref:Fe2+ or Zn2+ uptake regulation protein n=1 Tax=Eubacterium multiforme TaxID=83339 RepID=A0ABT9UTR3_9FIRM|nr:Fur family transcriptional regulator [Eubacterium multiforme]MDQ0149690.1 Fe2+ or Zn2+ uptake regulation protein [Eubacterium multiforme]